MSETKVTDIQARHDAAEDGRRMDIGEGWQAHDDRGVLLDEIREADAALVAIGIADDGRTLAERIGALRYAADWRQKWDDLRRAKDADDITRAQVTHGLDILRRAALAAAATLGEEVPEDAGPETIAAALRESVDTQQGAFRVLAESKMGAVESMLGAERGAALRKRAALAGPLPTSILATTGPNPLAGPPCAICGRAGLDHDYHPDEPSDIWPIDAFVYCKVCHKTHAARAGEKMCGGPGSWIAE